MEEMFRRLNEGELREIYPGLHETAGHTADVVLKYCKVFRRDAKLLIPPLLIRRGEDYKHDLAIANRNSTRINRTVENSPFGTDITNGITHTSSEEVEWHLSSEIGRDMLYGILAEEYIHNLTTFQEGKRVHVGFTNFDMPRKLHNLKPGGIYSETGFAKLPDDADSLREDPQDIQLTEHVTELAVNLMYGDLCPHLAARDQLAVFAGFYDKSPLLIPKKSIPIRRVIDTLMTGNKNSFKKLNPQMYEKFLDPATNVFMYDPAAGFGKTMFAYTVRMQGDESSQ